ncbi:hypothetical protein MM1S1540310_0845 [Mycobacteroides abscessus subsp. bolletii 1S-154-0310]|uniref:Uncharacterized protein n=1 Tax=Mycobacteroides abscessus MAB_091912_2446 TaxID=1335414 RepID=A0A829M8R9_9MYCO|nr:hypothetical protein MM1S1510930_1286 [Mycobacteroides abscessus subsp. bolletii 1S-151-0930]EIU69158.1 hypothetical protein MM1S1520914_1494 [Mycobacteroides abscessus subsp. bolletii 1S-152-0914]EIU81908.1 hypothetical protein MM1S1530915_0831 [Mycobacteroides abscessus subsp. bolletii 1S-153-0915]EIU85105.1 hypothetical protein MM1S1540310_0845 [Mycobacteroides abscessus subsp. bolletii 1S-154-0310]EIU86462.1 hypothetical protein MM2B0626_1209 [Mycobacteroides abscessus subsp. bolletii 2B
MRPWAHVKDKACIGERLVGRIYAGVYAGWAESIRAYRLSSSTHSRAERAC